MALSSPQRRKIAEADIARRKGPRKAAGWGDWEKDLEQYHKDNFWRRQNMQSGGSNLPDYRTTITKKLEGLYQRALQGNKFAYDVLRSIATTTERADLDNPKGRKGLGLPEPRWDALADPEQVNLARKLLRQLDSQR